MSGGVGQAISMIKGLYDLLGKMELNKIVRKRYQSQVKILTGVLSNVESKLLEYPKIQRKSKIIMALNDLEEKIRQGLRECNRCSYVDDFVHKNITYAGSQSKKVDNLEHTLSQAVSTAQIAVQVISIHITENLIQAQKNEMINQSLNPCGGVFECHDGELPLAVTDVVAKPGGPYLMISWKDSEENASRKENKYEIKLHVTNATDPNSKLCLPCETYNVRIIDKVQPWEECNVQVRAVNNAGYGPWSEPPCNVVMNQSPPKQPQLQDISYNAPNQDSLYIVIQRNEEHNKQQITHCILEQTHPDENITRSSYVFSDLTGTLPMLIRIPPECQQCKYRIKFVNQWGESLLTEELTTPIISSLLPGKPHNVHFVEVSLTHTEVWITWEEPQTNAGAVYGYKVERRQLHSSWEEIPPETGIDPLERTLKDLRIDTRLPQIASELQSTMCNEGREVFRVVKNLKQDTPYQFQILAANKEGQTGPPSQTLQVKTKLHGAFKKAAKAFDVVSNYIELFAQIASNHQDSSSRIARVAQYVSKYKEQLCLPALPIQNPGSKLDSESDTHSDNNSKEVETPNL